LWCDANTRDAVVVFFESTNRLAFSCVFRELVTFVANTLVFETSAVFAFFIARFQAFSVEHFEVIVTGANTFVVANPIGTRLLAALSVFDHLLLLAFMCFQVFIKVVMALTLVRTHAISVDACWVANGNTIAFWILFETFLALTYIRCDAFTIFTAFARCIALELRDFVVAFVTFAFIWCNAPCVYALESFVASKLKRANRFAV
jgi:hypothetical protein